MQSLLSMLIYFFCPSSAKQATIAHSECLLYRPIPAGEAYPAGGGSLLDH